MTNTSTTDDQPGAVRMLALIVALALALAASMGIARLDRAVVEQDQGQEAGERAAMPANSLLPIDHAMFDLAAATGGDFYFWTTDEFARSQPRIPIGGDTVVLSYGALANEGSAVPLPVDPSIGTLELFVGAQRLDAFRLVDPYGHELSGTDPSVDIQTFERMRIASIDRPTAGEWRVEWKGSGRFALSVHAISSRGDRSRLGTLDPIQIIDFDFVELRGRPGHEGFFPLKRSVVSGARERFELDLAGDVRSANVLLVALDGRVLEKARMDALYGDDDTWATVSGECTIPSEPFRVLATGIDAMGARYQRVSDALVVPGTDAAAAPGR